MPYKEYNAVMLCPSGFDHFCCDFLSMGYINLAKEKTTFLVKKWMFVSFFLFVI